MACFVALMGKYGCDLFYVLSAAYPAVYGQFPQAIPQPMSAVAPAQREGKAHKNHPKKKCKTFRYVFN